MRKKLKKILIRRVGIKSKGKDFLKSINRMNNLELLETELPKFICWLLEPNYENNESFKVKQFKSLLKKVDSKITFDDLCYLLKEIHFGEISSSFN